MTQFACPLPPAILSKAIDRVLNSGTITNKDRNSFLAATFCGNKLSSYEEAKIKEIYKLLKRGHLEVVD